MEENKTETTEMLHSFVPKAVKTLFSPMFLGVVVGIIAIGVGFGYVVAPKGAKGISSGMSAQSGQSAIGKGTIVGSSDTKTFKDQAEGVLENGGIEGEGQYHLVRPGGDSQNVYLTSSIVDLSTFVKKKIRVWGETNSAQKAGWLMDVGRVEVLE